MKKIGLIIMILILAAAANNGTCQKPWPWQKEHCREMEEAILDATVRIVFHGRLEVENGYEVQRINGTISHATVVDGRYLLTHNHFGIPLSQVQQYNRYANGGFNGISVTRLDGTVLLDHAPLDSVTVETEEGETVLLDFGTVDGEGFFAHAGVPSAAVSGAGTVELVPGAEVAQIDWDLQGHTEVVWVKITAVYEENGLPLMRVEHFIELGASGGGVYLNGRHIGNNWGRILIDHKIERGHESLVALNG